MTKEQLKSARKQLEQAGWEYMFTIVCHQFDKCGLHFKKQGLTFILNKTTLAKIPV